MTHGITTHRSKRTWHRQRRTRRRPRSQRGRPASSSRQALGLPKRVILGTPLHAFPYAYDGSWWACFFHLGGVPDHATRWDMETPSVILPRTMRRREAAGRGMRMLHSSSQRIHENGDIDSILDCSSTSDSIALQPTAKPKAGKRARLVPEFSIASLNSHFFLARRVQARRMRTCLAPLGGARNTGKRSTHFSSASAASDTTCRAIPTNQIQAGTHFTMWRSGTASATALVSLVGAAGASFATSLRQTAALKCR